MNRAYHVNYDVLLEITPAVPLNTRGLKHVALNLYLVELRNSLCFNFVKNYFFSELFSVMAVAQERLGSVQRKLEE